MDIIKILFDSMYKNNASWIRGAMLYNRVRDLITEAYYYDEITEEQFDELTKYLSEIRF